MRRVFIVAALMVGIAGCGSSSSAPAAPSLPVNPRLTAGSYFFSVRPLSGFQGCSGAWSNAVAARAGGVVLIEDRGEWLARPDATTRGDLVLRLQEGSAGSIIGTIRGQLVTTVGPNDEVSLGVTFDTSSGAGALVTGTALSDLRQAFGRIEGVITFVDRQQPAPMVCGVGEWVLSPSVL